MPTISTTATETAKLPFPFVVVTDEEAMWSQIPNFNTARTWCPPEFRTLLNPWREAAFCLHSEGGWTKRRQDIAAKLLISDDAWVIKAQMRYLNVWLGSHLAEHREKIAICA